MNDAVPFLGIGLALLGFGLWGAFGPERFNPLALKGRYQGSVRPSLARAIRYLIGGMFILAGGAVTAVGIAALMK